MWYILVRNTFINIFIQIALECGKIEQWWQNADRIFRKGFMYVLHVYSISAVFMDIISRIKIIFSSNDFKFGTTPISHFLQLLETCAIIDHVHVNSDFTSSFWFEHLIIPAWIWSWILLLYVSRSTSQTLIGYRLRESLNGSININDLLFKT